MSALRGLAAVALVALVGAAAPKAPEPADEAGAFAQASKLIADRSYAKACALFTTFLERWPASPQAREATAKRAHACLRAGKEPAKRFDELHAFADSPPDDFARAYARWALVERGERLDPKTGADRVAPALDLLASIAQKSAAREASDAKALLIDLATAEIGKVQDAQVDAMVQRVTAADPSAEQRDRALFLRARRQLGSPALRTRAEGELLQVGEGGSPWADDALFALAGFYDSLNPAKAVELYARVAKMDPKKADQRLAAERRMAALKAATLSLAVAYVEFPGAKPEATLTYRNVSEVRLTVLRVDPLSQAPEKVFETSGFDVEGARGRPVRTWTQELDAPPFTQASKALVLEGLPAGAYVLEAEGNGARARALVLVTRIASVLKVAPDKVLVWTADAVTGRPAAGARVAVYLAENVDGDDQAFVRLDATSDASGLATVALGKRRPASLYAWSLHGDAPAVASSDGAALYEAERVHLGYVFTDRPLYRPGDKVGVKVFVRTRQRGPSRPMAGAEVLATISDPTGKQLDARKLKTNAFGTASYALQLGKDAALGRYSFTVDPAREDAEWGLETNEGGFEVEEYKAPEYQVSVEPVGRPKPGEAIRVRIKAAYYSGGPIAGAQGRAIVQQSSFEHEWRPWEGERADDAAWSDYAYGYGDSERFTFMDPWEPYPDAEEEPQPPRPAGPGAAVAFPRTLTFKTGPDGVAEVEIVPAGVFASEVRYEVEALVTDASRREVAAQGAVVVSEAPVFLDLRTERFVYKAGERVKVQLRAEAADGAPASAEVDLRLVRLGDEGIAGELGRRTIAVADGRGEADFDADALGPARVELRRAGASLKAPPLAVADVWLANDKAPAVPLTDELALVTDTAPLQVGSLARAILVSPRGGGHALVTIEGDTVHAARVVELKGRTRFVELPLTADMVPNVVLSVTALSRLEIETAQVALRVRGGAGEVGVKVAFAAPTAQPSASPAVDVKLTGAPARAEVALTVVDEALYAIAPEPEDFLGFFGMPPRGTSVLTASSLQFEEFRPLPEEAEAPPAPETKFKPLDFSGARGALPGRRMKSGGFVGASGAGGFGDLDDAAPRAAHAPRATSAPSRADEAKESRSPRDSGGATAQPAAPLPPVRVRRDFGGSAGWMPSLGAAVGGRVQARAKLTDSLTSWRAVALVVTDGAGVGVGRASLRTEQPLMVRLQAPRFFTERDEVTLSAVVTTAWTKAAPVDVAFTVPGLKPLGPTSKRLQVKPGEQARFDARYSVAGAGDRKVRVTARSGDTTDAVELTLPAVLHGTAKRVAHAGKLEGAATLALELPQRRNPGGTRFELTVSPSLGDVMLDAIPFLATYPYGCVEQTMSRFVPAVVAARAVRQHGLRSKRIPADLDAMVKSGLARLYGFQRPDGGWGWWHADAPNFWMSAYVTWGLSLGKAAGVAVDEAVLARARTFLVNGLGAAAGRPEEYAFMVFALANTGAAPKVALDAAHASFGKLPPRGRAMVALALAEAKDPRAAALAEGLGDQVLAARPADVSPYLAWREADAVEAMAYALLALARAAPKAAVVPRLTESLLAQRSGGQWRTTRDTALAIFALSEQVSSAAAQGAGTLSVRVNGREVAKVAYGKGGGAIEKAIVLADAAFKPGRNDVEIRADGGGGGHWALLWDVLDEAEDVKASGGELAVSRRYVILGRPGGEKAISTMEYGMALESGERVRVDLDVTAARPMEFVMIEDLKPAGLEAVLQQSGPEVCGNACTHAELRSDRVAMFLTHLPMGTRRLSYELRAEVPGRFHGLPARGQAMYSPQIRATSDEWRVEVRDAPTPTSGVATEGGK